jgi:hypothetical protein
MRSTTLRWIGLALLGIVIAAGVAVAASSLASRQIGLSSEPISAGDALVPANLDKGPGEGKRGTTTATTPTAPPETTVTAPPPPETTVVTPPPPTAPPREGGEDHGGDGGSGDDD